MAFHLSAKLCTVGTVIAVLITAFTAPKQEELLLYFPPRSEILATARNLPPYQTTGPFGPVANPRLLLRATGYNSHPNQTDSTPHVTATGQRTRFGIIAVSRDLLQHSLPYGSLVRIRDLGSYQSGRGSGKFQRLLDDQELFIVEDTMHPRKRQQVDVWFDSYAGAVDWGVRQVEIQVIRYGRSGPELRITPTKDFQAVPQLVATR